jgi:Fe2+ or Zn2+ uptake regulation protein
MTMAIGDDQLKQQLRAAGLKATPARMAVLRLLRRSAAPLHVRDVLRALGRRAPDQATVYRALRSFSAAGVVDEVLLQAGAVRFEIAARPHHHHVTCERCGRIEDVTAGCVKLRPAPAAFRRITQHAVEFSGICKKCA